MLGIGAFVTNQMIDDDQRGMTLRLDALWSLGIAAEWQWTNTRRLSIGLSESRGLRQRDIEGLSERHVRRIEQGIARLTGDSAAKLAGPFRMEMDELLQRISTSVSADLFAYSRATT